MDLPRCSECRTDTGPSDHAIVVQGRSLPASSSNSKNSRLDAPVISSIHEKQLQGRVSKREKLTAKEAVEIFAMRPKAEGSILSKRGNMTNCTIIAPKYGVSPKTIRDIWHGRTWSQATQHLRSSDEPIKKRFAKNQDPICSYSATYSPCKFRNKDLIIPFRGEDQPGSCQRIGYHVSISDNQSAVSGSSVKDYGWSNTLTDSTCLQATSAITQLLSFAPLYPLPPPPPPHISWLQAALFLQELSPQAPKRQQQQSLPYPSPVTLLNSTPFPQTPTPHPPAHACRAALPLHSGVCTLPPLNFPPSL